MATPASVVLDKQTTRREIELPDLWSERSGSEPSAAAQRDMWQRMA